MSIFDSFQNIIKTVSYKLMCQKYSLAQECLTFTLKQKQHEQYNGLFRLYLTNSDIATLKVKLQNCNYSNLEIYPRW